jgi:hypothetical protein
MVGYVVVVVVMDGGEAQNMTQIFSIAYVLCLFFYSFTKEMWTPWIIGICLSVLIVIVVIIVIIVTCAVDKSIFTAEVPQPLIQHSNSKVAQVNNWKKLPDNPTVKFRVMVWGEPAEHKVLVSGLVRQIYLVTNMKEEFPLLPNMKNSSNRPAYAIDTNIDKWLLRQASEPIPVGLLIAAIRIEWIYMDVQENGDVYRVMYEDYVSTPMDAGQVLKLEDKNKWTIWSKWSVKHAIFPLMKGEIIAVPEKAESCSIQFYWEKQSLVPNAKIAIHFA